MPRVFPRRWSSLSRKYVRIGLSFPPDDLDFIDAEADRLSKLNHRSPPTKHSNGTWFTRCETIRYILDTYRKQQREAARTAIKEAR